MTFTITHRPSPRLLRLLRAAHDDGQPEISVIASPPALVVTRRDGAELSDSEQTEVRALLAADGVETI